MGVKTARGERGLNGIAIVSFGSNFEKEGEAVRLRDYPTTEVPAVDQARLKDEKPVKGFESKCKITS